MGTLITENQCWELAHQAALQGAGKTSPNPLVGAVAVDRQHFFLGCAFHAALGGPHAEAALLLQLQQQGLYERLKGGTIFVSLEPCCHYQGKKTTPCTEALIAASPKHVKFGLLDPNPQVAGKGAARLQAAGIQAEEAPREWRLAFRDLIFDFWFRHRFQQKIFWTMKVASSLDGMMAFPPDSHKRWITGARAQEFGHFLRLRYDAIAVGSQTMIQDRPQLTMRHQRLRSRGFQRNPARLIFDPHGKALASAPEVKDTKTLWLMNDRPPSHDPQLEILALPRNAQGYFALEELEEQLTHQGIYSVLLEGGASLYGAFMNAGKVAQLYLFQAPFFIGSGGLPWNLHMRLPFPSPTETSLQKLDQDILWNLKFAKG